MERTGRASDLVSSAFKKKADDDVFHHYRRKGEGSAFYTGCDKLLRFWDLAYGENKIYDSFRKSSIKPSHTTCFCALTRSRKPISDIFSVLPSLRGKVKLKVTD